MRQTSFLTVIAIWIGGAVLSALFIWYDLRRAGDFSIAVAGPSSLVAKLRMMARLARALPLVVFALIVVPFVLVGLTIYWIVGRA